ncbi:MAG: CARDB domain-containing protein, partial [Lewinella sp.]|uniref:CARDB domain-containing protein n=1 Tax=Lewinella sp. TaxID=2004506 RepID=UPI003D6B65AE
MYADENFSDEECQEWNNGSFSYFQVLAAPDLEITAINSDDIQYCQDGSPSLMYTVRNTGEANAPAFHVDFYLSNNQSLGSSDIHLGRVTSPSLGDGVTQTRTANNLSIPTSTSPGDYYILAVIDDDELIPEQFENNNLFATSYEIDVLPSPNIIYPSEGDVISSLTPTFQWSSVSGATAYAIIVFSSTNSVIYSANVGNTTSFTLPTNILDYDEEYSWVAGVSTSAGICPSDRIYFSVGCNDYFEPNNTFSSPDLSAFSTFGSSPSAESINAYITSESDVDYYLITTSNSGILNITLSSLSENYDLELHYGDYSDLISASTNLGTISENINYQHPGGTSTYLVKIYSFFDEYDCSDSYDLTIAWTPTGDGGGLALFQSINTSPSPIVYNRTGYFATRIINNNGLTWQGDLRLELLDEQGNDPPLNVIAEYNDTSIPSGGTDTLFHITNMPVSTLPGDYTLRVRYSDDNGITWNTVGNGGFPQPQPFKIVYSPIALNTAISVTPATVYQYSPAEFSAEIINFGNTGFTDSIALQLLNAQQTYLTNLDIDYVSLASDDTHILQLQSNSIQSDPGTYYVQVGAYIDGVWRKAHEGAFVNPFQFIIAAPLNQLSLTTPNGGESYTVNSTITITWTSTGTTGNISLELTDPLGTTIDVIADNIPNTGSFTYTIPNCLLAGDYRIELYETANTVNNDISDGVFSISGQGDFPCICSIDSPSLENGDETELVNAANFLCSEGIIIEGDGNTRPYDNITRGELAQIVFLALFGTTEAQPSDNFPSPFGDLQTSSAWYYRFAKTLAYLDYNDGTSPFDREFDNFRPYDPINRQYVVKVLLEAFNISEDGLNFNPYSDVNTGTDNYSHIVTAYDLCLIGNPPNFRPTIPATRGEVFLMIYRLLQTCASNNVAIPTPANDDFFCPGNYTPENLARSIGMAEGNFNTYSHNSFAIPGVKLPLVFGFQYNSYLTELPDALFPLRPLGHGWTHSYDSYILPVLGWSDAAGTTIEDQLILAWPTGQREVYFDSGGSYPYTCTARTEGTYNTLTVLSTSVIEVKTKGQTVYRYEKMSVGNGGEEAYLLTSIIERNGHTISVAYELGEAGEHRIATVTRQLGNSNTVRRQFSFSYKTGTNYLESVSIELPGMTGTSISFSVDNEGDLQTFTDRRSKTTSYGYARDLVPNMPADEYERVKHLLYTVQLPKGNTITNSYDKRKLNASATNGELLTQIDINFQYQDELQPITSNIQTISNENNNGTITQQINVDFDKGSGSATRVVLNGD